jgi:arsenite methyltransferase
VIAETGRDPWAAWFGGRRHGGDPELLRRQLEELAPIRDQVIASAALGPGKRVLDIGCGDGLIALAAAEAVGPTGHVVCSDASDQVLHQCRERAAQRGLLERCSFVQASASDLSAIGDQTIDAVTVRSVLMYEPKKEKAFGEFYRVLRPGGRLSLFEPINRLLQADPNCWWGYDIAPVAELASKLSQVYAAVQPPSDSTMDFDERDLMRFAEAAGFKEVALQLNVAVGPAQPLPWRTLVNMVGIPFVPTLGEAMQQAFTPQEADRFTAHLRPLVEQGHGHRRIAVSYLGGTRSTRDHTVTVSTAWG